MTKESTLNIIDLEYGMKQRINDELKTLPEEYTALIIVNSKNYEKVIYAFMEILVSDLKLFGTYITTNWPFRKIMQKFLKRGIEADNLFFIDCVTKEVDKDGGTGVKVFSSENVNEINVVLDKAIKSKKKGGEFIFLDSVSTLLVYNDEKTVQKFVHSLLGRVYKWKTKGIVITVETKSNKEVIENLSLFFDRIIQIME